MKIHRFFVEQPLGEEKVNIEEKNILHQWNNVLKLKKDENLILFNSIQNIDYIYKIYNINKNEAILELDNKVDNLNQINNLNLCFSLIKKENLHLILEKCSEIGVLNFIPIISERTEKKNIASFNKEKCKKIIIEAIEQSGWGNIPSIKDIIKLENFLKEIEKKGDLEKIIILDINTSSPQKTPDLTTALSHRMSPKLQRMEQREGEIQNTYILIGPEGGWTENERNIFEKYNLNIISFGENALRSETAAIIGSFLFIKK